MRQREAERDVSTQAVPEHVDSLEAGGIERRHDVFHESADAERSRTIWRLTMTLELHLMHDTPWRDDGRQWSELRACAKCAMQEQEGHAC